MVLFITRLLRDIFFFRNFFFRPLPILFQLFSLRVFWRFGNNLTESWVWLLVQAPFSDPGLGSEKKANIVWFTCGRPLGFYSSWPTFTLTLHMLVWLSAD